MRLVLISLLALPVVMACGSGDDTADANTDECHTDDDCPDGQRCVITHDHEGDDHDHGGDCEDAE